MKHVSHKNICNSGTVQVHVDQPLIPLIKSNNNDKPHKDFVKIKLGRDLTSETLDLYEIKTALFDNGNPEEFLLFVINFNMTLKVLGTLKAEAKIQYICMLVCGEALCQFVALSIEV